MATFRIDPRRSRLFADARSSLHPIRVETTPLDGEIEVEIEPPSLLVVKVHPDVKIRAKVVARRVT